MNVGDDDAWMERPDMLEDDVDEHARLENHGFEAGRTLQVGCTPTTGIFNPVAHAFAEQLMKQTGGDPEGDVPRLVPGYGQDN